MSEVLLIERTEGVATLTLNRPQALNALDEALRQALLDAIREVGADPAVRAVVLTGAGRGFCVGQDLRAHLAVLEAGEADPVATVRKHYNPLVLAMTGLGKPVVAAVNGVAAGAGAGIAYACDFRIAGRNSAFLLAFANVGLALDSGVSWTLPRLIGTSRALALAMLAEPVTAEAALEMGMVNAVVEPDAVVPAALELASRLAAGPTLAYAAIKASIYSAATSDLPTALEREAQLQSEVAATEDHRIGVAAFVEKKSARFVGR